LVDDITFDQPHQPYLELVTPHGFGQQRAVVEGLNRIRLLWTDGDVFIAVDWRVLDPEKDGKSQNDQLPQMLDSLVLNLIVSFGIDGIPAWISSSCCASGAGHFGLV